MSQQKKKNPTKQKAPEKRPELTKRPATFLDRPLSIWTQVGIALLLGYLLILILFPKNVFQHYDFAFGGDNLAAAPLAKMGEDFAKEGAIPQWCPYILGGMPTVGSLLYANHYYPGFALGNLLSFLFMGSSYGWLFMHFLLAGLGVFLVLHELKVHWALAALCSLFFAFNPTMAVFADVGHGSKLMTIAYLPWIFYFTKRLFDQPRIDRAALLALTFGLQLLALHVQIAYYGAMLMGLYAVFSFVAGGKTELKTNIKATLLLAAAGALAFGVSAPLYLQVAEYTPFSIRGGGSTGGASWDYATAWSFHPLESLTYIFPSFFGFGGSTYWGFMPFTDMPLYWGGVIVLFAPLALWLRRDRTTIFLVVLTLLAWVVSFGKFVPILFYPLFELLPYFNKFRVPSLIQVLVLLPVVLLAGRGLQAIWEAASGRREQAEDLGAKLQWVGIAVGGLCLILLILQAAIRPTFLNWIEAARPQLRGEGAVEAFSLFTGDLVRLLLLCGALLGSAVMVLKQKWSKWILMVVVALAAVLELNYFNRKLIHPTAPQQMEAYLQPTKGTQFLQNLTRTEEPFRIFPMVSNRNPDWYMPFRLESVMGYTGAKPRLYQNAVDSLSYNNFNLLRMLNTRYFITDKPLVHEDFEEVFSSPGEHIFRYKKALPRAFLVNHAVAIPSSSEILDLYRTGLFDFSKYAATEVSLQANLETEATGSVKWVTKKPESMSLEIESSGQQLLVLSEPYYPTGWTAKLNGRDVPILKVNYLFRGVEIPAGQHRLEMTFRPKSLALGNTLKWISLALIAAGLLYSLGLRHRRPESATRAK